VTALAQHKPPCKRGRLVAILLGLFRRVDPIESKNHHTILRLQCDGVAIRDVNNLPMMNITSAGLELSTPQKQANDHKYTNQ
tara:strand:- start:3295 stop:3540 length:246 start_codon:yes stop_codon:yes gene_type:complete